jgi:hypothetical protein
MRTNANPALSTDAHSLDTVLETSHHIATSDAKGIGLIRLNDVASIQRERINNLNVAPTLRDSTLAHREVLEFDTAAPVLQGENA